MQIRWLTFFAGTSDYGLEGIGVGASFWFGRARLPASNAGSNAFISNASANDTVGVTSPFSEPRTSLLGFSDRI